MPRARPSATATIRTSSRSEPDAEWPRLAATPVYDSSAAALALALDDHALEDLRAAPRALDDLEVDPDAVAGGKARDPAQLLALEAVDDGAHGRERPRTGRREGRLAERQIMVANPRRASGSARPARRARSH